MGRHDREDRHHHKSDRRKEEDKYSLQELKERARETIKHRNTGRGGGGGDRDSYDSREHRNDHYRNRDRSRSREDNVRRLDTGHPRSSPPRYPSSSYRDNRQYTNERDDSRGNREHKKFDHHSRSNNNFDRNHKRDNKYNGSGDETKPEEEEEVQAEIKPNFELTGTLAQDTNLFNGVVVKYNEPAEAKKPRKQWRLYPFKGDTALEFIPVHRQSAYLFGRDRKVADIAIDHPSCSKQHAVLQYRSIEFERDDGTKGRKTCPYIIDLESANGTFINYKKVDPKRYVELLERDVIKFGFSTREYVLLHEQSQKEEEENDEEAA